MRFRAVIFTNFTRCRSTGRIEIPECNIAQVIRHVIISQHGLNHQFSPAVNISRADRKFFLNRPFLRFAVNSSRGRKYNCVNACFAHRIKKAETASHIIIIITTRIFHGFTNKTAGSKMHDSINLIFPHDMFKKIQIMDITINQQDILRHSISMPGRKIIVDNRYKAAIF